MISPLVLHLEDIRDNKTLALLNSCFQESASKKRYRLVLAPSVDPVLRVFQKWMPEVKEYRSDIVICQAVIVLLSRPDYIEEDACVIIQHVMIPRNLDLWKCLATVNVGAFHSTHRPCVTQCLWEQYCWPHVEGISTNEREMRIQHWDHHLLSDDYYVFNLFKYRSWRRSRKETCHFTEFLIDS